MATAVRAAASAMEAAATTVELSPAAEVAAATEAVAAVEVSAAIAAIKSACVSAATVVATAAAIIPAATVAVSATIVAVSIIAVIPGAGADEDTAYEPIRSVEAIGCAGVRIIIVVAVGADWRWAVVGRAADSDAEGDALGLRVRGGEETNSETNGE